ncbi:integrator complex subunit 8-like [Styela clava]
MNDLAFPNAPATDTVVWYEFLLDDDKLKIHLDSTDPDPSGTELIKKFFEQANKPINDQGKILAPPENQRNLSLKCLALQTAALLHWDLNLFEKELPMSSRHQLLRELLAFCNASSFPSHTVDIKNQIITMHDHTIMAIVLYCRWAARTVVKSAFPMKPGGRITPTAPTPGFYQPNAQQRYEELKSQIVSIVKDQCFDIVQTLESFLQQVKRPVYVPDFDVIKNKQLCSTEETTGWLISLEELHAQVCYDLGCLHFMHGFYDKAYEMFGHVKEWLKCFTDTSTGYCDVNNDTLKGYLIACASLNPDQEVVKSVSNDTIYHKVLKCLENITSSDIRELGTLLMDDIKLNELSMSFRDQIEQDILYENQQSTNLDLYFDVIWSNALCRTVRGYPQPSCLWTYELNVAQLQKILGFVQECYSCLSRKGRKKLGGFLYSLHNNLFKEPLRHHLLQCEVTRLCLSPKDLHDMEQRETSRDNVVVQDSPTSPDSASSGPVVAIELECQLITCFEPDVLKQTLTKLHKISPESQHWRICDKWNITQDYESVLKGISVTISRDLMYILLAKVNQCLADSDQYQTAKHILNYIRDHGKSLSFKLHKISANELLRIELLELINDPSLKFSSESECHELREQLSDVIKRAIQHLSSRTSDVVPSPPELADLSIALLLNLEGASFFDSFASQSDGQVRFAKVLSKVHAKISSSSPPHQEAKRSASDLWTIFTAIFAATTHHQRRSQDNSITIAKANDVPTGLMSRPALLVMLKKLKNPRLLRIILSLLIRLHSICQEDILIDIKVPLLDLWPSSSSGIQHTISAACVVNAVREVLAHCLKIQPHYPLWLHTQADVDFAYCNYPAAFRNYLKLIAVQSNFFNRDLLNSGILDSQMVRRMVKCCLQMRCNTQAAVLCQMIKEVDYSTAFKALQESRERSDAMEVHYREHFWDVELLEYATCMHRDSVEVAKKESATRALANPDLNVCNTPKVLKEAQSFKSRRFFRSLARQFLV